MRTVARMSELTENERACLEAIHRMIEMGCVVSQSAVAEELGCSKRTVQYWMDSLRAKGWLDGPQVSPWSITRAGKKLLQRA